MPCCPNPLQREIKHNKQLPYLHVPLSSIKKPKPLQSTSLQSQYPYPPSSTPRRSVYHIIQMFNQFFIGR